MHRLGDSIKFSISTSIISQQFSHIQTSFSTKHREIRRRLKNFNCKMLLYPYTIYTHILISSNRYLWVDSIKLRLLATLRVSNDPKGEVFNSKKCSSYLFMVLSAKNLLYCHTNILYMMYNDEKRVKRDILYEYEMEVMREILERKLNG